MIDLDITTKGPLFAGRLPELERDMVADCVEAVATAVKEREVEIDRASFKAPRPFYWTQIRTLHPAYQTAVVDDANIVYGGWLEGTSARNQRSTFKGYRMWKRTFDDVSKQVPQLVAGAVEAFVRRLDG